MSNERPARRGVKVALAALTALTVYLAAEAIQPPRFQPSARACLAALDVYRSTGSSVVRSAGIRCRYTPSCSGYARDAISHYGTVGGVTRTIGRLWRCSPWGGCGHDPAVEASLGR